ncbi:MAG: STAS domain-containing protein [Actinomycetota bacterium]|nr:STAS domain-containing protein [Actinomycetota bacterium]
MSATLSAGSGLRVVTAADADGGLRLSLVGRVDASCIDLRDVVVAALRAEPPRVEIDLRNLDAIDTAGAEFLLACRRLAELLGVEYRLSRPNRAVGAALGSGSDER